MLKPRPGAACTWPARAWVGAKPAGPDAAAGAASAVAVASAAASVASALRIRSPWTIGGLPRIDLWCAHSIRHSYEVVQPFGLGQGFGKGIPTSRRGIQP